MTFKRRLDRLEVRTPDLEPDTPWPITPQGVKVAGQVITRRLKQGIPQSPDAIALLTEEVIRRLKNGTGKPRLLGVVPELLSSEHVPQELKEELKTLWHLGSAGRDSSRRSSSPTR